MTDRPSYEELLRKVNELESEISSRQQTEKKLENRESKYFDMFETYSDWIWENVIADKAERRQSEETLLDGESKYRDLVETFNDWIWETDANGAYTYVSPKVRDVLGYEPEEMLGTKIFEAMLPDEAERVIDVFTEIATTQMPFMFLETTNLHKNGHPVVFETSGKPFFHVDGSLLGFRGVARDVTERNRARKALKESEEKFRTFMETASDLMHIADQDGNLTYVNESMAKALGYSKEQMIGMNLTRLLGKELDEDKFKENFENFIKEGKMILGSTWETKDGRKIHGEVKVKAFYDHDGNYAGSRGVFRDLTEHKLAKDALRESESKFRDLVETVNDIIWEVNIEGAYTYVSPRVRSILGYEPEELLGTLFFELMSIGEAERLIELFMAHVAAQEPFESLETTAMHKDGHPVVLENSGKPFFNSQGKLIGFRGINRDITDRKQAEEALRESESRYRLLAENVTDVIWTMDMDTKFTYVSPSVTGQRGFSAEEAMAQRIEEIMTPASIEAAMTAYHDALEDERKEEPRDQNKSYVLELELNCKDGSTIWTEHTAAFLRDPVGKPVGVIGIMRDISERRRAEKALRESEERLALALEVTNDGIWDWDIINEKVHISDQFKELIGFNGDDSTIVIDDWTSKIHPDHRDSVIRNRQDHLAGKAPYNADYLYRRSNEEEYRWHNVRGMALFNENGKVYRMVGSIRDIHDRKQAEEALRESEERFALALEATTDGIWDRDISNNKFYISPHFRELLGIKEHGDLPLSSDDWALLIHPDHFNHVMNEFEELVAGKAAFNTDYLARDKTGEYRWYNIRGMALFDEDGKAYRIVGSVRDVHDRKQADEHIRSLTQKLIKAQENERQWISRELHDRVTQDLSSSKLECDLLLDHEPALAPEAMQKVSEISDTLTTTIYAVRDLAYELRPPGMEEAGLAQTASLYCEDLSEKSGLDIDFHSAGMDNLKLSPEAEINVFRLIQEGLNNIRKHADAVQATVRLMGAFPNIILRIEDNGKGFDVDQRLAAAMKEKRMGLRSMKERAGLLHGKMAIQSIPGEGTIISIKFPYEENKSESKENHTDR